MEPQQNQIIFAIKCCLSYIYSNPLLNQFLLVLQSIKYFIFTHYDPTQDFLRNFCKKLDNESLRAKQLSYYVAASLYCRFLKAYILFLTHLISPSLYLCSHPQTWGQSYKDFYTLGQIYEYVLKHVTMSCDKFLFLIMLGQ